MGDSEDAYGRTLAYVYLDTDRNGKYVHLFNGDLITLGLARTTTFSHANRREFERLREEAEERGATLPGWGADRSASYAAPTPDHTFLSDGSPQCGQLTLAAV